MSHDVFISYSSDDKVIAFAICEALEKGGVKCWIAPRDILGNYGAAIIKAIKNSKLMVLVLSSHANQSEHVHREVERAADKGLTIYPFRLEDVLPSEDLELFISSEQWFDAFPSPDDLNAIQIISNSINPPATTATHGSEATSFNLVLRGGCEGRVPPFFRNNSFTFSMNCSS